MFKIYQNCLKYNNINFPTSRAQRIEQRRSRMRLPLSRPPAVGVYQKRVDRRSGADRAVALDDMRSAEASFSSDPTLRNNT